jgi:hypothetical protein
MANPKFKAFLVFACGGIEVFDVSPAVVTFTENGKTRPILVAAGEDRMRKLSDQEIVDCIAVTKKRVEEISTLRKVN